ncbi:MAG: DUF2333 family protein [Alphaproteobacteria bacterium]|nr:DUF2333 family protein [Alphaproteobacteria bacterium]
MLKNLKKQIKLLIKKVSDYFINMYNKIPHIRSHKAWKKSILIIFVMFFILYYPLGAILTHNINTDLNYEPDTEKATSASIAALSHLIYQEVYENTWTPSLPFIFPAAILDNMPSFQQGVISSVQKTAEALAQTQTGVIASEQQNPLLTAAELLKYPPTIWMFSANNQLAPSSNSQYRRARKHLQKYNDLISDGRASFSVTPDNLRILLNAVGKDLFNTAINLEDHIREHNGITDIKSDESFYYTQGKMFGYYIISKGIMNDYKNILIDYNLYPIFTSIQKALENASLLSPLIIRNSNPQSIFGANHLFVLGHYALKTSLLIRQLISKLPTANN